MTYTYTLTLADGTRVEVVSTRTPQQRARYEHLRRLFGCWELKPTDDGMTAADWQAAAVAALTSGEFQTKLVAAQKQLAQVGEYARYYSRVVSKKALFPRDAAPLSFAEWYEKLVQGEQP